MSEKIALYKVRKRHREIFGTDEPRTFFELMLAVEGKEEFSGLNIFKYAERLDIKDIIKTHWPCEKISREEDLKYPFRELLKLLWEHERFPPLLFNEVDGGLHCFEGRHRLRLLILWYTYAEEEFKKHIGLVPCIVTTKTEEDIPQRIPEAYRLWVEWMCNHSWRKDAEQRLLTYGKFLRQE